MPVSGIKKLKIAVFGSGSGSNFEAIAAEVAFGILRGLIEIVLVVTNNSKAKIISRAQQYKIPVCVIPFAPYAGLSDKVGRRAHEEEILRSLESSCSEMPELIVLAGYMRILSPFFVGRFKNRILNIHPADIFQYQGPSGYEWALERRSWLSRTAITVHVVDEGVDTGPVIEKVECSVYPDDTLKILKKRGLAIEHKLYPQVLRNIVLGKIFFFNGRLV